MPEPLPCYYKESKPAVCESAQRRFDDLAADLDAAKADVKKVTDALAVAKDEAGILKDKLRKARRERKVFRARTIKLVEAIQQILSVPKIPEPRAYREAIDEAVSHMNAAEEDLYPPLRKGD